MMEGMGGDCLTGSFSSHVGADPSPSSGILTSRRCLLEVIKLKCENTVNERRTKERGTPSPSHRLEEVSAVLLLGRGGVCE